MSAKLRLDLESHVNLGELEAFFRRALQAGLNRGDFVEVVGATSQTSLQTPDLRFSRVELPTS